jgi:hypothetical protein
MPEFIVCDGRAGCGVACLPAAVAPLVLRVKARVSGTSPAMMISQKPAGFRLLFPSLAAALRAVGAA